MAGPQQSLAPAQALDGPAEPEITKLQYTDEVEDGPASEMISPRNEHVSRTSLPMLF